MGRRRGRAAVPAACVQRAARARPASDELHFLIEDVGPGTKRLCELDAGDELLLVGPLGVGLRTAARRAGAAARRRRRRDRAARDLAGTELGRRFRGRRRWLGFRDAAHAAGAATAARRPGSRPTTAASATTASSPSCSPTQLDARRARRGLRVRAAADARGGAAAVRRARDARPARARVGHGVRVRRLLRMRRPDHARAIVRLCVDGPVLDAADARDRPRRRSGPLTLSRRVLRDRARAPDHQRLGHVRRDRRPARVRRRAARAFPVRGVRLEDGDARAAPGQPAAAAVGARRRDDQLDRAAEQGPRGLPRRGPPEARDAAGAADRQRDGLQPRGGRRARRARSRSATRSARSS